MLLYTSSEDSINQIHEGLGIRKIASELSVGVGTVYKVLGADSV